MNYEVVLSFLLTWWKEEKKVRQLNSSHHDVMLLHTISSPFLCAPALIHTWCHCWQVQPEESSIILGDKNVSIVQREYSSLADTYIRYLDISDYPCISDFSGTQYQHFHKNQVTFSNWHPFIHWWQRLPYKVCLLHQQLFPFTHTDDTASGGTMGLSILP